MVGLVARRIARLLEHRGLGPEADPAEADLLAEEQPLLAQLYGASVAGRIATGRRAGQRVMRVGDCIDPEDLPALEGERCASVRGVSLHANVAVPARDRRRLERLYRYVARPPVATERLSRLDDGRLLYRLKHRWRDGTTHVVFERQELVEKLVALVPPPRFHLVRYHGILGPCASERCRVVPGAATEEAPPGKASIDLAVEPPGTTEGQRNEVDIPDRCSSLGQERHPPDVTQAILDCLVLPSRAPPTAAAAPSPDEWDEGFEATL